MIGKIVMEGLLLGTLLVVFCAVGIRKGAVHMVFLYHADVHGRCIHDGLITRGQIVKHRRLFNSLGLTV